MGPLKPLEFKSALLAGLGGEWPTPCDLNSQLIERIEYKKYSSEKISYSVEPGETVAAYVLIPHGVDENHPSPAIAVWHQHAGNFALGKSEPVGLQGDPLQFAGQQLAELGFIVICPDAVCFEERQDSILENFYFERFKFLKYVVEGKCLAWKNILDMRRCIDYLCTRVDVDASKLGCYGHSLGSTFTWLLGPWEPRLKCLVGNCCLPTYAAIHRTHLLHSFSNFIPGIARFGDVEDIAALIAPRRLHLNFGALDEMNPLPEVRQAVADIGAQFTQAGAGEQFSYFIEDNVGHTVSPAMWRRTSEIFEQVLLSNTKTELKKRI